MVNQRQKGARGEREWRDFLRAYLGCPDAIRGRQYRGGDDSPDVRNGIPGTHAEVKRTEKLRLHEAVEQAIRDAAPGEIPYVAHKANRRDWLVIVRADDLPEFARRIVAHLDKADPGCAESPS